MTEIKNQKFWDYYVLKSKSYDNFRSESENFKNSKINGLSIEHQSLINYVLLNFDISVLEFKDKNFDFCFKLRNNLILSLSNYLEN
jgi:hypothetical protein